MAMSDRDEVILQDLIRRFGDAVVHTVDLLERFARNYGTTIDHVGPFNIVKIVSEHNAYKHCEIDGMLRNKAIIQSRFFDAALDNPHFYDWVEAQFEEVRS